MRVARLAFAYRQEFNKDVVIDMVCYRRHGHNEGDDPSYTQPLMYKRIDARRSVRKLYTEALVKRGDITLEEAEAALDDFQPPPAGARSTRPASTRRPRARGPSPPRRPLGVLPHVDTGVSRAEIDTHLRARSRRCPTGFTVHPKLAKQFETRHADVRTTARSTGRWARPWPSARCCSRAPRCAWPARTPAGARSRTATRVLVDYETGDRVRAAGAPWPPTAPSSGSTTRCCRSTPPSASSTATRSSTRTPSSSGRRSSATSSTAPRSSSTSTSWPPRTSGARPPGWCCCCPTATRARAPSTRRRASSGSSRWPPRTTSRSATPPPRPSTSTCCAARCAAPCASR